MSAYMQQLEEERDRAYRAFLAAPSPRIGAALKQIERKMQYERRRIREGKQ